MAWMARLAALLNGLIGAACMYLVAESGAVYIVFSVSALALMCVWLHVATILQETEDLLIGNA